MVTTARLGRWNRLITAVNLAGDGLRSLEVKGEYAVRTW